VRHAGNKFEPARADFFLQVISGRKEQLGVPGASSASAGFPRTIDVTGGNDAWLRFGKRSLIA
jgi:hypothetical protein